MKLKGITEIQLSRFKAFNETISIGLSPITVLLGMNSTGKTSVIQSILLLKQTLEYAPIDTALKIDGPYVTFSHLKEFTFVQENSINEKSVKNQGPQISLSWDVETTLKELSENITKPFGRGELANLSQQLSWLSNYDEDRPIPLKTKFCLEFGWEKNTTVVKEWVLESTLITPSDSKEVSVIKITIERDESKFLISLHTPGQRKPKMFEIVRSSFTSRVVDKQNHDLQFEHFIPIIQSTDPRLRQSYWILFKKPLEALVSEIRAINFLGPLRAEPKRFYAHSGSGIGKNMDPNGGLVAEILAQEEGQLTHFADFIHITTRDGISKSGKKKAQQEVHLSKEIKCSTLIDGVNLFLQSILNNQPEENHRENLPQNVNVEGAWGTVYKINIGKKNQTIADVGFGVSQILPIIVAGLRADWAYGENKDFKGLDEYNLSSDFSHLIILEQPEIHLHPAAQSRLAQFLVSMALCGRRILLETHSDHLIRRLRGVIARTVNSDDEKRIIDLISIVNFNFSANGTAITQMQLDGEGKFVNAERPNETYWPKGFMDDSANEEEAIFAGWLNKNANRQNHGI